MIEILGFNYCHTHENKALYSQSDILSGRAYCSLVVDGKWRGGGWSSTYKKIKFMQ